MFDGLDPSVQPLFVGPGDLGRWVDRVRPHFAKMAAGSRGRYLPSDVEDMVRRGAWQLWVAVRGVDLMCVMVTEIHTFPRLREMRMIALVGCEPREWAHLLRAVETTAKENFGCTVITAFHIPRFAAILPGYTTTHWYSEKVLT